MLCENAADGMYQLASSQPAGAKQSANGNTVMAANQPHQ